MADGSECLGNIFYTKVHLIKDLRADEWGAWYKQKMKW